MGKVNLHLNDMGRPRLQLTDVTGDGTSGDNAKMLRSTIQHFAAVFC